MDDRHRHRARRVPCWPQGLLDLLNFEGLDKPHSFGRQASRSAPKTVQKPSLAIKLPILCLQTLQRLLFLALICEFLAIIFHFKQSCAWSTCLVVLPMVVQNSRMNPARDSSQTSKSRSLVGFAVTVLDRQSAADRSIGGYWEGREEGPSSSSSSPSPAMLVW